MNNSNLLCKKWSKEEKVSKPAPEVARAAIATQNYPIAQLHLPYLEMLCDLYAAVRLTWYKAALLSRLLFSFIIAVTTYILHLLIPFPLFLGLFL